MNHTHGPWELGYSDLGSQIISSADGYVAVVHYWSRPEQEMKANARLIAAAPDLLGALEELYAMVWGECPRLLNEDSGGDARLDSKIKDAITKARGES